MATERLGKRYGAVTALDGVTFEVSRGSIFALLGPNGAGKTTTFGLLTGALRASSGTATVLGVSSTELHRVSGRVAALPQDASLPRLTSVRTSLCHWARLSGASAAQAERSAERALERVGLAQVAGQRGRELSHGMAKRVALAQALMGEPEVVFLDEPTAGLDPASARAVKDLVESLAPACTVVISSHNLAEVEEICTHAAVLERGRLLYSGPLDTLTRRGAEVSYLLGDGASVSLEQLASAVPEAALSLTGTVLRARFASDRPVAEVNAKILGALIAAGTPILEVRQGTSLERAFLDLVKR